MNCVSFVCIPCPGLFHFCWSVKLLDNNYCFMAYHGVNCTTNRKYSILIISYFHLLNKPSLCEIRHGIQFTFVATPRCRCTTVLNVCGSRFIGRFRAVNTCQTWLLHVNLPAWFWVALYLLKRLLGSSEYVVCFGARAIRDDDDYGKQLKHQTMFINVDNRCLSWWLIAFNVGLKSRTG